MSIKDEILVCLHAVSPQTLPPCNLSQWHGFPSCVSLVVLCQQAGSLGWGESLLGSWVGRALYSSPQTQGLAPPPPRPVLVRVKPSAPSPESTLGLAVTQFRGWEGTQRLEPGPLVPSPPHHGPLRACEQSDLASHGTWDHSVSLAELLWGSRSPRWYHLTLWLGVFCFPFMVG